MTAGYGGDRVRRDLHRVHCRGCDDPAHRDEGPVGAEAAREALRGEWPEHPATQEDRLRRLYFGHDE